MSLREDADKITQAAIQASLPDAAVAQALQTHHLQGNLYVIAVGKAAWQMADAAAKTLGSRIKHGVVITKYNHSKGAIGAMDIFEAGHPVPDENSVLATKAAIALAEPLQASDIVIFLLSGGGSSLFELPLIPLSELTDITLQLLASGADIREMNTIRKRLSAVKGGRFAKICAPARVFSIILSDVLGDPLDMIASGPTVSDTTTCEQAQQIVKKYNLSLSSRAMALLCEDTEHTLSNVKSTITGSVSILCKAGAKMAKELGYSPIVLTDRLCCTARDAGSFLASIAQTWHNGTKSIAFFAGGETVAHLQGTGLGGRNQELALAAAEGISGLKQTAIFSVGSDGTDGPTDAAGGYVDGDSFEVLRKKGVDVSRVLQENDSYHALAACDGLIVTAPTGTNVNDMAVVLIRREETEGRLETQHQGST